MDCRKRQKGGKDSFCNGVANGGVWNVFRKQDFWGSIGYGSYGVEVLNLLFFLSPSTPPSLPSFPVFPPLSHRVKSLNDYD